MKKQLQGKKSPNKYVLMEVLSDEYGWTPKEIREQDERDIKIYLQIVQLKRLLEKNK